VPRLPLPGRLRPRVPGPAARFFSAAGGREAKSEGRPRASEAGPVPGKGRRGTPGRNEQMGMPPQWGLYWL